MKLFRLLVYFCLDIYNLVVMAHAQKCNTHPTRLTFGARLLLRFDWFRRVEIRSLVHLTTDAFKRSIIPASHPIAYN